MNLIIWHVNRFLYYFFDFIIIYKKFQLIFNVVINGVLNTGK